MKNKVILDPFQPEKEKETEYLKTCSWRSTRSSSPWCDERRAGKLKDDETVFSGLF